MIKKIDLTKFIHLPIIIMKLCSSVQCVCQVGALTLLSRRREQKNTDVEAIGFLGPFFSDSEESDATFFYRPAVKYCRLYLTLYLQSPYPTKTHNNSMYTLFQNLYPTLYNPDSLHYLCFIHQFTTLLLEQPLNFYKCYYQVKLGIVCQTTSVWLMRWMYFL